MKPGAVSAVAGFFIGRGFWGFSGPENSREFGVDSLAQQANGEPLLWLPRVTGLGINHGDHYPA